MSVADRHQTVDSAIARIARIALERLALDTHAALELDARHPSTPDGYPTQTPGHAVTPAGPPAVLEGPCGEPACPHDRPCPTHDIPVGWTPVERAVAHRSHHHDEISALTRRTVDALAAAADSLELADRLLTDVTKRRGQRPALDDCCELLASIGAYAPGHRWIPDPNDPNHDDPNDPDHQDRRRYRVGRWVYDFTRRNGRFPHPAELRNHQLGHRQPTGTRQ